MREQRMLMNLGRLNKVAVSLLCASMMFGAMACKNTKPDDKKQLTASNSKLPPPEAQEEFKKAVAFYEEGNYKKADRRLEDVTQISPNFAKAWYNRGVIAEKEGDKEKPDEGDKTKGSSKMKCRTW